MVFFSGGVIGGLVVILALSLRSDHLVSSVTNFKLLDQKGEIHELYQKKDVKFVVLIAHGNGCPIIQKYSLKLNNLRETFKPKGIEFLFLNANPEDDAKSVMQEAIDYAVKLPILLDPTQAVARELGFTRTSETVVLETKNWNVVYRGPINDQLDYGVDKQRAQNEYLENALDNLLMGRAPAADPPSAKGCLISFGSGVTPPPPGP